MTSPPGPGPSFDVAFASAWIHPQLPVAPRQASLGSPVAGPLYPTVKTPDKSGGITAAPTRSRLQQDSPASPSARAK